MDFLNSSKKWILPALVLLCLTPFSPWIDLGIARYFYAHSNDPVEHFMTSPLLNFIFDAGPLAATLTAAGAALLLFGSYVSSHLRKWRNPCLVLVLTYAIGAGLIINGGLKEYWGRPRPKQIEEFGGTQAFRAYYEPNFFHQPQPSKSFTCGHCAMGFYFFALALVGRRLKNSKLETAGFILAFALGAILSLSRMMQGGHFFTDTLFSALVMWYTALAIDWLVYEGEPFP
jgi:lipid A 4'-phosphatase